MPILRDTIHKKGYQLWLVPVLFILAVIVKAVLLRTYLYIDGDRSLQVVAAAEWASGLGYTIPETDLGSMNIVHHKLLLEWPPLYSAMLVPLFRWTKNMATSCCIMDTLGAFFYLWAIWKITIQIGFRPWLQLVVVWFRATEIYEGFIASFPTDFLAAACWLWAIYFFMRYVESPEKKWLAGIAISMAAGFLFRYVYLTALPVLPALLWYNGSRKNNAAWKRDGIALGLIMAVVVLIYLGYNKINTGTFTYLENWEKGFYPSKLGNMVPLFWQSIAHVTFIGVQLQLLFHQPYGLFFYLMLISSTFLLGLLLFNWLRRYNPLELDGRILSGFGPPAFWVSAAIIFTLAALSIRIDFPKDSMGGTWSYLVEDRYFLVPFCIITIVITGVLFGRPWRRPGWQVVLRPWLLFFLFVQLAHTGWILQKRIPLIISENPAAPKDVSGKRSSLLALFDEGRNKGNDVVLLSNGYGYIYIAWNQGIKVCRQISHLEEGTKIGVSGPTTIVVAIKEMEYRKYKKFFDANHFELRKRFIEEVHLIATIQPVRL